jgi:hypothetical protein
MPFGMCPAAAAAAAQSSQAHYLHAVTDMNISDAVAAAALEPNYSHMHSSTCFAAVTGCCNMQRMGAPSDPASLQAQLAVRHI